jgi:superfamily II DNA helicase RecQ
VVAVPNRALLEDLKHRMIDFGLDASEWRVETREVFRVMPIIFVSGNVLGQESFLTMLCHLKKAGTLKSIMVDEAHFRYCLQNPTELATLKVDMHFFTTTVKPDQVHKIEQAFGHRPGKFVTLRGSTGRTNIKYNVV